MRSHWRRFVSWLIDGLAESACGLCGTPAVDLIWPAPDVLRYGNPNLTSTTQTRIRWRAGIGDECQAFLAGRYYQIVGRRETAPDWVWLNVVAHADRSRLERLGRQSGHSNRRLAALSYLAVEVLAACDHEHLPLDRAQRAVLMPFESDLLARAQASGDLARLVAAIRSRLELAARTPGP